MELTINFIKNAFNQYNNEFFNGELKTPNFKISRAKFILGQFSVKKGEYYISISEYFARSEFDLRQTIVHEMIHQWQQQTYGYCDHKETFKKKAAEIGRNSDFKITRLDAKRYQINESFKVSNSKIYVIFFNEIETNKRCMLVTSETNVSKFYFRLHKHKDMYKNLKTYYTYDRGINSQFKLTRSGRYYYANDALYNAVMEAYQLKEEE